MSRLHGGREASSHEKPRARRAQGAGAGDVPPRSIYLDPEERSVGKTSQAAGGGRREEGRGRDRGANKHRYDLATGRGRAGICAPSGPPEIGRYIKRGGLRRCYAPLAECCRFPRIECR